MCGWGGARREARSSRGRRAAGRGIWLPPSENSTGYMSHCAAAAPSGPRACPTSLHSNRTQRNPSQPTPPPPALPLFQTPENLKTPTGEEAFNPDGLAQRTIKLLKDTFPDLEVRRGCSACYNLCAGLCACVFSGCEEIWHTCVRDREGARVHAGAPRGDRWRTTDQRKAWWLASRCTLSANCTPWACTHPSNPHPPIHPCATPTPGVH